LELLRINIISLIIAFGMTYSYNAVAQNNQTIDSLISLQSQLRGDEAIRNSKFILEYSKKTGYNKGIIEGYLAMGKLSAS